MQVPGPSRRQGQRWTHLQHRSGRDWRPQAELRHVPWALGRRQCAWGSQGRPVPATEAYEPPPGPWQKYTCTAHILSIRHLWLAALETEYWARWTLALMEYCCSQGLVFCYVFPRETAQAFLKWTEEKKKITGKWNWSHQKDLRAFSSGAHPASDWGLDLWASLVSEMWSFAILWKPS